MYELKMNANSTYAAYPSPSSDESQQQEETPERLMLHEELDLGHCLCSKAIHQKVLVKDRLDEPTAEVRRRRLRNARRMKVKRIGRVKMRDKTDTIAH
jgi:hypothetical protein